MKWLKMFWTLGNDVQQKGWWASKTVWFNIATLVAAIAATKGLNLDANDITSIAAGASTIGNIILRFSTEKPIGRTSIPLPPDGTLAP
jgi:hypothetical protein